MFWREGKWGVCREPEFGNKNNLQCFCVSYRDRICLLTDQDRFVLSHVDEMRLSLRLRRLGAPNLICIATIQVFTLLAGHSTNIYDLSNAFIAGSEIQQLTQQRGAGVHQADNTRLLDTSQQRLVVLRHADATES